MIKAFCNRIFTLLLAALLLFCMLPATVSAAAISETVDLSNVRKNERGTGYNWDNINDILTLTNLDLETTSQYGFKIPDGANVVLVGNNRIKASTAALVINGSASFRGEGTLTLEGATGAINVSSSQLSRLTFISGSYNITAAKDGIRSEYIPLTISGGNFNINITGKDGNAIMSKKLKLFGCSITADSSFYSQNEMEIRACSLDIAADGAVLTSAFPIILGAMDITDSSGNIIAEYNGESAIKTVSTYVKPSHSIIFGDACPAFVDYILFAFILLLLAALIALPIIRQRKKDKLRRELYEAEHPKKLKK